MEHGQASKKRTEYGEELVRRLVGPWRAANRALVTAETGVAYTIACNAVGAAEPSNWSNPVTLIAI